VRLVVDKRIFLATVILHPDRREPDVAVTFRLLIVYA
jgi:hypothetical protein